MALPDLSVLTEDELSQVVREAENERVRRGAYNEAQDYIVRVLTAARDSGATKAQVTNFLTKVVNQLYPPA